MQGEGAAVTPAGRSKQLIDASSHVPLTIERLADEANLSPFHLIREFRRQFYVTPHQYVIRRRIERARELLSETEMSVTDICLEVGFESLGSFSRLFRRATGWPPSVYRARCLERRREPRKFIPGCFWIMHRLDDGGPGRPAQSSREN